jgi:hypothetical protein
MLKPHEMYGTMFRDRISQVLQEQYDEVETASAGQRLQIWKKVAKDCFENEDEETRKAVLAELNKQTKLRG